MANAVAYALRVDVESLYGASRLIEVVPDTPGQNTEEYINDLLEASASEIDNAFLAASIDISPGDFSAITDPGQAQRFEKRVKAVNVWLAVEQMQAGSRALPEGFVSLIEMAHTWLDKVAKGEISIVAAEGDRFGVADETVFPLFNEKQFDIASNILELGPIV